MVIWTALTIVAGTVRHRNRPARRRREGPPLHFWSVRWATRVHSVIVWIAVLMALSLLWHLRKLAHDREVLDAPLTAWGVRDRPG